MNMSKILRPLLLALGGASLLLAMGCRTVIGGSCHKEQPYAAAEDLQPLRVPAGLDAPDTGTALQIPALAEPEAPLDPDGPCLDAPPAIVAPELPPSGIEAPPPGALQRSSRREREADSPDEPDEQPRRR